MSDCNHARAHLNDFIDGTLTAARFEEVQAHLNGCGACRREYDAYRATIELVRSAPVPDGSSSWTRSMGRFRRAVEEKDTTSPARSLRSWAPWVLSSGVTVAAATLFLLAVHLHDTAETEPAAPAIAGLVTAYLGTTAALPGPGALDEMTSMHAVRSFTIPEGAAEAQQEALADATSRLGPVTGVQ